jgi:excisionase family DNA binding protein
LSNNHKTKPEKLSAEPEPFYVVVPEEEALEVEEQVLAEMDAEQDILDGASDEPLEETPEEVVPDQDLFEGYTVPEAAKVLGRSVPTVYYMLRTGKIQRAYVSKTKRMVITKDSVDALAAVLVDRTDPDLVDYTAEEAAEALGCSVATVFRHATAGKIRRRHANGRVVFLQEDVEKLK